MATVRSLELLAGRALVDDSFRARLRKNPRTAAREINVRLTPGDVELISSANWDALDKLADEVRSGMPKMVAAWAGLKADDLSRPGDSFAPKTSTRGAARGSAAASAPSTARSAKGGSPAKGATPTGSAAAKSTGGGKSSGASKSTGAAKSKGASARKSSGKGKS